MSSEFNFLRKNRGHIRTRLTKIINSSNPDIMSSEEKYSTLCKLEEISIDLDNLNTSISNALWAKVEGEDDQSEMDDEWNQCDEYKDKLSELFTRLKYDTQVNVAGSSRDTFSSQTRLKLPEVPLPEFSNNVGESLQSFLSGFESILNKHNLSSYEKFMFLKKQLKNEPLILINSLDTASQTYEQAKSLLHEAFACTTSQKFRVIADLSKLKMKKNLYEFVSEMKVIKDRFSTLSINIETILQYFFWNAMNPAFQGQLINICNNNKPTLNDIEANIYKAIDRYKELNLHVGDEYRKSEACSFSSKNEVEGFAVDISSPRPKYSSSKKLFCSLCSNKNDDMDDHQTSNCPQYKTAESKLKRLKSINACCRCGFYNHSTKECNFRFNNPCYNCQKFHMSFLCTKSVVSNENRKPVIKNNDGSKSKEYKSVTNNVVWTENVMQVNSGSDSVLPTFSCMVGHKKLRCLKDSGCQPHFITCDVAESLNLPVVVSDFQITINGFNESKCYNTKIVKVNLLLSDVEHSVNAICVPEIKTKMFLPGLPGVINLFTEKNYKLADDYLHAGVEYISDINFVLGTSDPYILPEEQIVFGSEIKSVYSQTHAGILLMGNLDRMKYNMRELPVNRVCDNVSEPSNDYCPLPLANSFTNYSVCAFPSNSDLNVINDNDKINEDESMLVTEEILESQYQKVLNYDDDNETNMTDVNKDIVKYVLANTRVDHNGRLIMPLTWRSNVSHLLGRNFELAKSILTSNFKKLQKQPGHLAMVDDVFNEQLEMGIIDKICNVQEYLENNPECSVLAHMSIFKLDKATTKCRNVFLSNLSEANSLSHNQCILPGPCLNSKMFTSMLNLRFGEYLLIYDLKKAFLQIGLNECDSNRLLFLWYNDVQKGDFSIIGYRNLRLSFGLRCSPTILMLAMYKILIVDSTCDSVELQQLKKTMYALLYVDNGGYSGSKGQVEYAYSQLNKVFNPYCFEVQQLVVNNNDLQARADRDYEQQTDDTVGLLGLQWNRLSDQIGIKITKLDITADTKRSVLSSIAAVYDPLNLIGPCLNRAKIFLHECQCNKDYSWDSKLPDDRLKEWKLICKQFNKIPEVYIPRFVGNREDNYSLIAFSDASKLVYGTVVYLKNLRDSNISFVCAKNKLVNVKMNEKSIPSLELQALNLAVEVLLDVKTELTGENVVLPINIEQCYVFTDSMINLHWLKSYNYKFEKMEKHSVYVQNRLSNIMKLCVQSRIDFKFVSTDINPADCITRKVSYSQLKSSSYFAGPNFLKNASDYYSEFTVSLPNPTTVSNNCFSSTVLCEDNLSHIVPLDKYSDFTKLGRVTANVMRFVNILKCKLKSVDSVKYEHINVAKFGNNYYRDAVNLILSREQRIKFPEIFSYFSQQSNKSEIPELVKRLNIFVDKNGILKIKSKFERWQDNRQFKYPILLPKDSEVTYMIIRESHVRKSHCGLYSLLTDLRKIFWIPCFFSVVKKVLKICTVCKRMNGRPVKINQNSYRDFRACPPAVPYQYVFIDYLGPFQVQVAKNKVKVFLLCVTCLWSRSVNIKICPDLTLKSFLRSFQMHVFEEGVPERVLSDLGSQLTAGGEMITKYLREPEFERYFHENGIQTISFDHYFKGNSSLGSLVEICVKMIKRLVYGAIRNNVLKYHDFELIIAQTVSLLNKRPIAFKEVLRDNSNDVVPSPITPELLTKGREL